MVPSDIKYPVDVATEFFIREQEQGLLNSFQQKAVPLPVEVESPSKPILTQLVETILFASMATEEGHLTPVGIVFAESIEPFQADAPAWDFLRFSSSWKFEVNSIVKLASACGSNNSFLVVVPQDEVLKLAGIATSHSRGFFEHDHLVRVLVLKPGVVSVCRGEREIVRYEHGRLRPRPPALLGRGGQHRAQLDSIEQAIFQKEDSSRLNANTEDFLQPIVQAMIRLGHGGLLLILGPEDEPGTLLDGAKVLAEPLRFGASRRGMYDAQVAEFENLMQRVSPETDDPAEDEESIAENTKKAVGRVDRLIEQIARLTTVDGAVVMSHSLEVLAFGVKISSGEESPKVFTVTNDRRPGEVWPLATRGTRHRAAAIFARQHPQGLAFIVSQDGDAAIFQKLESEIVYWPLPF